MNYLDQKVYIQNSGDAWSYRSSEDVTRFEVRSGDSWYQDANLPKERSELATSTKLDFGQTYEMSFSMLVEAGSKNTADWMTLVQIQSTFDEREAGHSPAFALEMVGDKMRIVTRDSSAFLSTAADTSYVRHYTDKTDIQRDKWYDFKLTIKLDAFGDGYLEVLRDGKVLATYEGALGFNDLVGSYLKLGVYRESSPESFAVQFRDVEVERLHEPPAAEPVNLPLAMISNGGGHTATISVAENTLNVTKVAAVDPEGVSPTYSIVGGADAGFFTIDKASGALSFLSKPDYEKPKSADGDNAYAVTVRASDGVNTFDQAISVQVTNVAEASKPALGRTIETLKVSHYDSGWTFSKAEVSTVEVRAAENKIVTEHRVDGRLMSTSIESQRADGKTNVQFYDGNWKTTGLEVTSYGEKTVTERFDASWKFVSAEVVSYRDGKMVAEHYDSQWRFTGADVGTDNGARGLIEHFDAHWMLQSKEVVRADGNKLVTEHYSDQGAFIGSDIANRLASGSSVLHDPMVDWLLA